MTVDDSVDAEGWRLPPFRIAAFWLVLALASVWYTAWTVAEMLLTDSAADWHALMAAAQHGITPGLYDSRLYQWSPLLVPVIGLLTPVGILGWRILHIGAALAFPTWRGRLIVLASWPFWFDLSLGNLVVFIVLSAAWALRGSQAASIVFLALTMLIPRPIMLPVAIWLLWKRPELRISCIGLALLLGAVTLATGLTTEWMGSLLTSAKSAGQWSAGVGGWDFNIGPSRWMGIWWLPIGITLAVWLTWRGRLGWASLAVSPYLLPYYLLFGVLEFAQPKTTQRR